MKKARYRIYFSLLCAALCLCVGQARAQSIVNIAATDDTVEVALDNPGAVTVRIYPVPVYTAYNPVAPGTPLYQGNGHGAVNLPRFSGATDLLYSGFQLATLANAALGVPQYVTDLGGLSRIEDADPQGWKAQGNGGLLNAANGLLNLTFFDPAPELFDPFYGNSASINADAAYYFSMRIRLTNPEKSPVPFAVYSFGGGTGRQGFSVAATGQWQTVSADLRNTTGASWTGTRTIRLDPADGEHNNVALYDQMVAEIDWMAVTDDPAYNGGAIGANDMRWTFESDRNFPMPAPEGIKGCDVQIVSDLIDLDIKHAKVNCLVNAVLDFTTPNPSTSWTVDGEVFGINTSYVNGLDSSIKALTDAGMRVSVVLLNGIPTTDDPNNPLIHPDSDLANAPNHLGAFNTTDRAGYRAYRAGLEYLAHRYSDPSGSSGLARDWIVGNEVDAHWWWHNQGEVSMTSFMADYARQVRLADLAVRRFHADNRVFISMTHFWNDEIGSNTLRAGKGTDVIELMNTHAKAGGDFPWDVAHHPYPENLRDPEFWLDTIPTMTLSTPQITYGNIEMLPVYLEQEHLLWNGHRRRVILSEQGFDSAVVGHDRQAAALAYACYKLEHTAGIDAHILHRHVDHGGEGGLLLGLWTHDTSTLNTPLAKKPAWYVYEAWETAGWQAAFDPYLPYLPFNHWDDALPRRTHVDFLFDVDGETDGWVDTNQTSGFSVSGGTLDMTATGTDPYITREDLFLLGDVTPVITVRMATTTTGPAQLFWKTTTANAYAGVRSRNFATTNDGAYHLYTLDLSGDAEWAGKEITALRLDPGTSTGTVSIDFIHAPVIDGDADGDGVLDQDEAVGDADNDSHPNALDADADNDGIDDGQEVAMGLDPYNADSDDDGVSDGVELTQGSDPKLPGSVPQMTVIWLDFAAESPEMLTFAQPGRSIAGALPALAAGGTLRCKGNSAQPFTAETPRITQASRLEAYEGSVRIGVGTAPPPSPSSAFDMGSIIEALVGGQ